MEQYTYKTKAERLTKISEAEGQGLVMLHDNFDPSWKPGDEPFGTLTFTDPIPPTDEELYQLQLVEEMNDVHEQAILALKNWASLTLAQKDTILKGLVKWALWKDEWLKLGVL